MKALRVLTGLIALFVTMPIWYYLIYTLLKAANVDRLVWFLFWVYMPVNILTRAVDEITWKVNRIEEQEVKTKG